ncbi:hypothetical protein FY034_00370 [Trichlorobacter lovleyi]|uniref:hypothetical protein n=1 Tax=Trichlorobacter lovleyi TaxID=313985 RepID=UPI00223FD087|nr:hypothetical protein [Trichlorobacter lovleyi]QOX77461.1 hypothetical protein FY034_00370 [Trichlorobacter lovleyi]
MHTQIRCLTILLLLLAASLASAATPDELSSAVTSNYRITIPGFFGNFKAIGNVLIPRREGLGVNRPSNLFKPNLVKNRQLVMAGGGDLPLGDGHGNRLKPGERLYLYGVSTGDTYLQLDLYTVATYVVPGMRGPQALQASVRFQYDNGLAALTTDQLLDDISDWFDTEEETRPAAKPRKAATATRTVRLGQTPEQVTAIFGPPEKQVLLGAKQVFVYSGLKVIFVDGKVVDAE